MYPRTLVTAPTIEPVTVQEVKDHSNIFIDSDDTLIETYITSARIHVENMTNRALITQTWDLFLDEFCSVITIPKAPLQSVSSISYLDTAGASQTLSSATYTVDTDSIPGRVYLAYQKNWPSIRGDRNGITIRFVAGYGGRSAVPEVIKHAMKMLVAHWYENREYSMSMALNEVPMGVRSILNNERIW